MTFGIEDSPGGLICKYSDFEHQAKLFYKAKNCEYYAQRPFAIAITIATLERKSSPGMGQSQTEYEECPCRQDFILGHLLGGLCSFLSLSQQSQRHSSSLRAHIAWIAPGRASLRSKQKTNFTTSLGNPRSRHNLWSAPRNYMAQKFPTGLCWRTVRKKIPMV